VLTPTRELARQVADVISSLTDSLSTVCVYGGAPISPQGLYVIWCNSSGVTVAVVLSHALITCMPAVLEQLVLLLVCACWCHGMNVCVIVNP